MDETWVYAVMGGVSADEPRPHFHCERCVAREAETMLNSIIEVDREFFPSRTAEEKHRLAETPEAFGRRLAQELIRTAKERLERQRP
jgi:hypothetical protein